MSKERANRPRQYEVFGITEDEVSRWRIDDAKFKEILNDQGTTIYNIDASSNNYGEFLFVTTGRRFGKQSTYMTFWGLGYHNYRERWIHREWFWYQVSAKNVDPQETIEADQGLELIEQRRGEISQNLNEDTQTELGRMFETLADMTDDDAALAEMQDLGLI